MLFNSVDFALFVPIVFLIYWFVTNKNLRIQNVFIIAASFTFYGWWDYRFLALLLSSAIINFSIGRLLLDQQKDSKRKTLLWVAVTYNLGLLGVFKYFNFFTGSLATAFSFFGVDISLGSLNIILPVGISFFTFQALGYIIDVYNRKYEPTKDIISFSAFISFFPLILAGPIERGDQLLPQFNKKRTFDYSQAVDGMRQILWGLFKKIVIADNCLIYTDNIFNNHIEYSGSTLLLGAILFTIQIYADFSGYSDIAIGVSRLFGFNLIRNFNFPYFATNVADFWRRWHISLSSWLRDYLFTPLSINMRNWGMAGVVLSLIITFLLCGLWHGANYTFIVWGILHGLALTWDVISAKRRKKIRKRMKPVYYNFISWGITFIFIVFSWIFFKAVNMSSALNYISEIFTPNILSVPWLKNRIYYIPLCFFITVMFVCEWNQRTKQHGLATLFSKHRIFRRVFYVMLITIIYFYFCYHNELNNSFIYFQF